MKRYALPLIILGVTVILLVIIALTSTSPVDYSGGKASSQPMSQEWVRGSSAAHVVVVEYSDFQCPACNSYEPLLRQVATLYGDRVAFVYRHFPLYQIHANADLTARASEAAGKQGKFWQMHDMLFDKHSEWAEATNGEAFMLSYAAAIGLDGAQFKTDLSSSEVKQLVADDYARGLAAGVNSTPTFAVNGIKLDKNPQSVDEFKTLLDAALLK